MPDPRTYSPSFSNVQRVADAALESETGMTVVFAVAKYGTYANCEHAARGFQKSFTSLRARAARLSAQRMGESSSMPPRDSMAHGIYSDLICQRSRLEDRVEVFVGPSSVLLKDMDVYDMATGERITDFGSAKSEKNILNDLAASHPERLTQAQYDRLGELIPGYWRALTDGGPNPWFPRPGGPKHVEGEFVDPVEALAGVDDVFRDDNGN